MDEKSSYFCNVISRQADIASLHGGEMRKYRDECCTYAQKEIRGRKVRDTILGIGDHSLFKSILESPHSANIQFHSFFLAFAVILISLIFFFPPFFSVKTLGIKILEFPSLHFDFIFITFTHSRAWTTRGLTNRSDDIRFFFLVLDDNRGKKIVINPTSMHGLHLSARTQIEEMSLDFIDGVQSPLVSWLLSVGSFMSLEYFSRLKSLITRIYLVNECKS